MYPLRLSGWSGIFRCFGSFLKFLERARLRIKPTKFQLFSRRFIFCCQILTKRCRMVDPVRTAAIPRWTPEMIRTPTHMKARLGFVQWYSMYIDRFSHLSALLTESLRGLELTKKEKKQLARSLRAQFPGLILRWPQISLQSSSGHKVPRTDSMPVRDSPERICRCAQSFRIPLGFAEFSVPRRFISIVCEI